MECNQTLPSNVTAGGRRSSSGGKIHNQRRLKRTTGLSLLGRDPAESSYAPARGGPSLLDGDEERLFGEPPRRLAMMVRLEGCSIGPRIREVGSNDRDRMHN